MFPHLCGREMSCIWKSTEVFHRLPDVMQFMRQRHYCNPLGFTLANVLNRSLFQYPSPGKYDQSITFGSENTGVYELNRPSDELEGQSKLIQVAVVGTPNAGKSTFVNQIVKRRVCAISRKVHTTRNRVRAIVNEGDTQIVFLDTPGLVNASESKRHNLEKAFLVDAEVCVGESDVVIVIHDVSNKWTRDRLDVKVLKLLHIYHNKPSVLVMNKVDLLKSKRKLLDLTSALTCRSLKGNEANHGDWKVMIDKNSQDQPTLGHKIMPVIDIDTALKDEIGWPGFEDVFMISALDGNDVEAVKEFILQKAKPRPWLYPPTVFTDQNMEDLILLAVREKLLENLPQEIPYNLDAELEHLHISPAGDVTAVVLISCVLKRHVKLLIGAGGRKIRKVAKTAEEALEATLMENVRLKLVVVEHRK